MLSQHVANMLLTCVGWLTNALDLEGAFDEDCDAISTFDGDGDAMGRT